METGCAYNSHSVSLSDAQRVPPVMFPPNFQNYKAIRAEGEIKTETPENKKKIGWKQRTRMIREWEIKRKGKTTQMEKGDKKRRLAKIEKTKARKICMGNEGKKKIGVANGKIRLIVATMNLDDIRSKETREILAKSLGKMKIDVAMIQETHTGEIMANGDKEIIPSM